MGQLAAGVAHDFNNIMAVIVLYSQMALRTPGLAPKLHDYLATIVREADQAGALIQQILDFGRKGILERTAIDLLPFLKEQHKLLARTLPESIRVDLVDDSSGPYAVSADLGRLRQAIMNLALNARDAMPDGGEMTIELGRTKIVDPKDAPFADMGVGDWITVRIVDTGIGIAPDVLPRIFEPFFTTKGAGGNGLGLAQVYGIIGQHGGHIGVESDVGVGTAFTIYLPALPVLPDGLRPEGAVSVPRGDGEVILIVEDNEVVRQTLANTLEFQGYRAVSAKDGRQALALLEAQPAQGGQPSPNSRSVVPKPPPGGGDADQRIAMILCDLVMPEMGGQALFHAIRERGWQIPMAMLSGHPMGKEFEALQDQGLAGWLAKPPKLDELAGLVAKVLGKV